LGSFVKTLFGEEICKGADVSVWHERDFEDNLE